MIPPRLDRIGLVMMSAIGDTVHALAVVRALKRHAPRARISWILQPLPATLVRGHPDVDEILEFQPANGFPEWRRLRRDLRAREFDLVVDLQVALKAGIVTSFTRAPRKLGFDRARAKDLNWLFTNERIPPHDNQHVLDQYFEFLHVLGVPTEPVEWNLGPWPDERAWQRDFVTSVGAPYAAIAIATSSQDRDWMPERWATVIDALQDEFGLRTVLIGGTSARELDVEREIVSRVRHKPVSALGSGLRRLVSDVDGSSLVLAGDTAALHIAVAVGRPVISLMSQADPRRTGPFRRFHDLIIDAYHDPGERAPISAERRYGRMARITTDDVLAKLRVWNSTYR